MSLEEYFGKWLKVIDRKKLEEILAVLETEYRRKLICPEQNKVFRAFELCPYDELKIVFLGQDPYAQKNVATGILFGNSKDTPEDKLSPSLQVIKEAAIDFGVPHNCILFDHTLENWAKQGILMLNSALTVEMNKIGSHIMLWRPFISSLLKKLSEYNTAIVYVLFGRQAQTFRPYISKETNYIIEIEHPAYFARTDSRMPHKLFEEMDELMNNIYGIPIEWYKEY